MALSGDDLNFCVHSVGECGKNNRNAEAERSRLAERGVRKTQRDREREREMGAEDVKTM